MARRKDLSLSDILTCSVCYDLYDDPVILRCGHEFCKKCIVKCSSHKCPLCQQGFEKHDLVSAYKTKEMCDNLQTLRGNEGGKETDLSTFCRWHTDERAKWICLPCKEGVCGCCLYEKKHEGKRHQLEKLSEAYLNIKTEKEHFQKILHDALDSFEQQRDFELDVINELETIMARKVLQVRYDLLNTVSAYESKVLDMIQNWNPAVKMEPLREQGKKQILLEHSIKDKNHVSCELVVKELKHKLDMEKLVSALELASVAAEQTTVTDLAKIKKAHDGIFDDMQRGVEFQVSELKATFNLIYSKLRERFVCERPKEDDIERRYSNGGEENRLEGAKLLKDPNRGYYDLRSAFVALTQCYIHCIEQVSKRGISIVLISIENGCIQKRFFYRFFGELAVLLAKRPPALFSLACRKSEGDFIYAVGREDMSDNDGVPSVVDIFSWNKQDEVVVNFSYSMRNVKCATFGPCGELIYMTTNVNENEVRMTNSMNPEQSRKICNIRENDLPSTTPTALCYDGLNKRIFINTWDGRLLNSSTETGHVGYVKLDYSDNVFSIGVNNKGNVAIVGSYWNAKGYEGQLIVIDSIGKEIGRWSKMNINWVAKSDKLCNMAYHQDTFVIMVKAKGVCKYYFIIINEMSS